MVGWVDVTWDNGANNLYRMGAEGKFDLKIAPTGKEECSKGDSTTPPSGISRRGVLSSLMRSNRLNNNRNQRYEQVSETLSVFIYTVYVYTLG